MKTKIYHVDAERPEPGILSRAGYVIARGGIVGFATETVYGLGANAADPAALERLRRLKNRPGGKPFTILLSESESLFDFVKAVPEGCMKLAKRYWPGPLTLVVPQEEGTIGFRVPAHDVARELVRQAGVPVAAPSANPSGLPPAKDAAEVLQHFDGKIDMLLDSGPAILKEASTVVRFYEDGRWDVLREGLIGEEMVARVVCRQVLFVCTANRCRSPMAAALCKKLLAERLECRVGDLPRLGYLVDSAGTAGIPDASATEKAIETMKARRCDISQHRAKALTPDMVDRADVVIVMTRQHLESIRDLMPHCEEKVRMLNPSGKDVDDPIGGTSDDYERCAREIERLLKQSVVPAL